MARTQIKKCHICKNNVQGGGAKQQGVRSAKVICDACLDRIFPERGERHVVVDRDMNIYFFDTESEKVFLFFSYGEVPYSSCTEIITTDDMEECGFSLL